MKKMGTRQMILTLLGSVVCKIGVMGCYPVAPAYFTALYLENGNGLALLGIMYIGMFLFMPLTAMIKYMVILLVTALAVKLVEWANEGCPAMIAGGLTGITTIIISFCGSMLQWKNQPEPLVVFLEAVFVCGAVVLLNRGIHGFLEWEWQPRLKEIKEHSGNEERLRGYAESFQGLSQIFMSMSNPKNQYNPAELGQVQNELKNLCILRFLRCLLGERFLPSIWCNFRAFNRNLAYGEAGGGQRGSVRAVLQKEP